MLGRGGTRQREKDQGRVAQQSSDVDSIHERLDRDDCDGGLALARIRPEPLDDQPHLPGLAQAVQFTYLQKHPLDTSAENHDIYDVNVAALAQAQKIVQTYLEVDVTIQKEDVQEITAAGRQLLQKDKEGDS